MSDRENTNNSNRKPAEYINSVPIMARPQRQEVDLFDPKEFKEPAKSKVAPYLVVTIGIVLLVVVAVGIAIGLASLLPGGKNAAKMEAGNKYFIELELFPNPDSVEKAKVVKKQLEDQGETMAMLIDRHEAGTLLIIGFFRVGEESFLSSKMESYKVLYPNLVKNHVQDDGQ